MFFSLLQTLICVLLVNSGLYALHLTGSNTPGSASGPNSNIVQPHAAASPLSKPSTTNSFQTSGQRLNEELADLAQLERERLMVLGLVKQTAESESGYHGRPVITGRIKMHPTEDMDSEYSNWLTQQGRNIMFGNVVKQPHNEEEDYDTGGGGDADVLSNVFDPLRSEHKYDYGRIVQPVDREREREFESPHNIDLDDFMELEPVPEEDDIFPDMDGYAYIEELMAEENKERLQRQHYQPQQHQQMLQFPGLRQTAAQQQQQHHLPFSRLNYQNHANMNEANKQLLQDFFETEQRLQNSLNHHQQQQQLHQQQQQQQQQQQASQFNAKYRNNIRSQQKWLRKRNHEQQQLQRNIFGQKNAKHHFNTFPNSKLALANSEATATTRLNNKQQIETAQQIKKPEQHQRLEQQKDLLTADTKDNKPKTSSVPDKSITDAQQKPELLQQTNHKRSGLTRAASMENGDTSAIVHSPQMLRKVRGQRQYDVPQIECPTAMDGMERFACPTPDLQGRYRCIDDHVLCDGFIDCPEGEDEDRRSCMFYKTTKAHLDVLADALLRWARGR